MDPDDNIKASTSKKNPLVHEVHENLDQIFQVDSFNSSTGYQNPLSIISAHLQKSPTIDSFSPIGGSYFNSNFDENGYVFDGVKIEIEDIDNTSMSNITTYTLKRCKEQVLKRYYSILCFIGWRPFFKEDYYKSPWFLTIINIIYPIIIVSLLFFAYSYDVITCQGKLNVVYDTYIPAIHILPAHHNNTTGKMTLAGSRLQTSTKANLSTSEQAMLNTEQCGHIFTTYIVPSIMHLASYILGFIYFRINENETLYALMEKVFLAVDQSNKAVSQDRVIKRLKIFMVLGLLWVILAMSVQVLSRLAYGIEQDNLEPIWLFIVLQAVSLIVTNSIYLAVVINHSTQCEMIIFYVNEVRTRLEEKSITIKDAMQQILDIRIALASLNSTAAKMTSLVSLTFIEKFIIGFIILVMNRNNEPIFWIYRSLYVFLWFIILAFTVIQPARLNSKCNKFKQIALSAEVYGYHNCTRDELDSFLLFISHANLRAKLFGLTLKPSYILATVICVTFTMIILVQTSVITSPDSFI